MKSQSGSRIINKRINDIVKKTDDILKQDENIIKQIENKDKLFATHMKYMSNVAKYPTYGNSDVFYYSSGEKLLPDLLDDLRNAKKFIFLEYFSIKSKNVFDSNYSYNKINIYFLIIIKENLLYAILKYNNKINYITLKIIYFSINFLFIL